MGTPYWGDMGTADWGVIGTADWGARAWQPILQQARHIHYGGAASVPHFHRVI